MPLNSFGYCKCKASTTGANENDLAKDDEKITSERETATKLYFCYRPIKYIRLTQTKSFWCA